MFNFVVFLLFASGIGLIAYSAIKFKPAEKPGTQEQVTESLAQLEATIADADSAMLEMSNISQSIFEEITLKYKELLYLYELIDQKKMNVNQVAGGTAPTLTSSPQMPPPLQPIMQQPVQAPLMSTPKPASPARQAESDHFMAMFNATENDKHREINTLYRNGMSIAEIARQLNIGHGEVSLVIEMRRGK